jgi:nitrite reductase/ring-hydroxylating ferredoxin subunit
MGQYDRHVFVCTSGETCPTQGDTERFVKMLRDGVRAANRQGDVRINKSGCFSQCGHGPMVVVYPENVWYAGVQESDLAEIVTSPTWKRVCEAADVPANGMKEFAVDGVSVLVVHTGDAFVAFQAMCPHEAVPLETGVHDGCTLTCLEHLWQFDLRTGAPMGDAQTGLKGYPLKEEQGQLYVAL